MGRASVAGEEAVLLGKGLGSSRMFKAEGHSLTHVQAAKTGTSETNKVVRDASALTRVTAPLWSDGAAPSET